TTIKIIPISARDITNKAMQSQAISITIDTQAPQISELLQSYPNPANQGCYIPFKLANDSNVSLEIYNILGQKVRTIEIGQRKAGSYTQKDRAIFFDLKNDSGQNLSSGLYFYKIKADDFSAIKSMVVK
ncbi:MAG: T9SS type A sorting domain-containing protein, partial [bacterium]